MQKIVLICCITFSLTACSVYKETGKIPYNNSEGSYLVLERVQELNLSNKDFTIVKADVELITSGEKQKFLATLKYKKGGIYLLSIKSKTGMELARLYINDDTILINDRINRRLYYASSNYIINKYGISAATFPVLFGDFIKIGETKNLSISCTDGRYETDEIFFKRSIRYIIDCNSGKVSEARIAEDRNDDYYLISFGGFEKMNGNVYPGKIEVTDSNRDIVIKISIDKVEIAEVKMIDFNPGNNFEKVLLK